MRACLIVCAPHCACACAGNAYLSAPLRSQLPRILDARDRGPTCFDAAYYWQENLDLQGTLLLGGEGGEGAPWG